MIIFYHELNSLSSGAAVLIVNLIRGLAKAGEKVLLINFKDGALHKELYDLDTSNLVVINNDKKSMRAVVRSLSDSDIIITTHFYTAYKLFKAANPKILFYCVNSTSLFEANRFFRVIKLSKLTRRFIRFLKNDNGIVFGDEYALKKNLEQFNLKHEHFELLPIPVAVPSQNMYLGRLENEKKENFEFTYVGRAIDWKMYPAKKVISDLLEQTVTNTNIIFHIITDNEILFKKSLPEINHKQVSLKFYENLSQQELIQFLSATSDLHFAMGTSALDGAKLGIPTILLDLSVEEFPCDYKYRFVHHSGPTYIGMDIKKGQVFEGETMNDLLRLLKTPIEIKKISEDSYQYILKHHNISKITSTFLNQINICKVHLRDTARYLLRYWV